MGMFDWVDYETTCKYCKKFVDGFQTKSGDCCMQKLKPEKTTGFYASCRGCGAWVDVEVKVKEYELKEHWTRPT